MFSERSERSLAPAKMFSERSERSLAPAKMFSERSERSLELAAWSKAHGETARTSQKKLHF
jgi:hypothetical protein